MGGSWKTLAAGAAALSMLGVAGVGLAQDQPPPPGAHGPMDGSKMHDHMREQMQQMRAHRAQALHDVLNIHPDQEGAWGAYQAALQSLRPRGPGGEGMRGPGGAPRREGPPVTTPERLDRMAAHMAERQTRVQQMIEATKRFYAALGPDQKRTFDELPLLEGHGGGHGGHGGFGGHEHAGQG
jgi:hypothetical protein